MRLLLLLIIFSRFCPAQDFFPVSVWYSGGKARAPMLEKIDATSGQRWREDLGKIKSLGFNTVRTWVEWNTGEPRQGEYRLENLDLMLKLAEEAGLKVIVQVYVDSAPEWVGQKIPDGRYAAQDNQPIPSQAAPGYCFDNRKVRHAVLAFLAEVARHASKSPAFYGYDLWSEPAALNWARIGYKAEPMFCYCASSTERFRQWLQAKYKTLDALNDAWHRTFSDWSQVEPPRYGTILTYTDFMDWRIYYGYKLAEDLKLRNDAVKSVDPKHVATSHAPNPSPLVRTLADPYDPTDDFLMSSSVDFYGTSFYPKLTSVDRNWTLERRVLAMDLTKAITGDRGFYVGELQSGFGVHGTIIGSEITPNDLQLWTWGMVARGAKAINYYAFYPMNAGYEAGGYGMINLDGTVTERSKMAGSTAQIVQQNADVLLSAKPVPAEVAIVFNPLVPLLGGFDAYGSRNAIHQAVAGYHRMFWERNITTDIVSSRDISAGNIAKYRLVIVPYPLMMTAEMATALETYVAKGGRLFVEARPGWQDERGHAEETIPGFGWTRLLGVREKSIHPVKQALLSWQGEEFPAMSFVERFEVVDVEAEAIIFDAQKTPIGYEHAFGKGKAILLGSFAGQANEQTPLKMNPLAGRLAAWAGIQAPSIAAPDRVELRRLRSPGGEMVFIFNHNDHHAQVKLKLELERKPSKISELISGATVNSTDSEFHLNATIPAESLRVYRISY